MISEAAITGKPIYVVQMITKKSNHRFIKFFNQFKNLNIIRDLNNNIEYWSYSKLNEVNKVAKVILKKMEINGIIKSS